MIFLFYALALIALATGTAAIYMALIKYFPAEWLYYHYFVRKPIVWIIFIGSTFWTIWQTWQLGAFPLGMIAPIILMIIAIILTYKMHQKSAFKAIDFPKMAEDTTALPLHNDMQLAIIEYQGETKAYPLDYVIHHHIINDRFGEHIIALTYCAMCRSIIPFDVTAIGPLFVGSFKGANMIVADRKTKTFFQQASFQSIIGKLHPYTLTAIPFQILSWKDVKNLKTLPQIVKVNKQDLKEFELPIPKVWKKIVTSEATPGLPAKDRDQSFPPRTHIIGIIDPNFPQIMYLKKEVIKHALIKNQELNIFLVATYDAVNGFKGSLDGNDIDLKLNPDYTLSDTISGTIWDMRGKWISGEIEMDLEPVALSDEYWFSWKRFHPKSKLIRL